MVEKMRVLFVDDEPELLSSFKRRFHQQFDMDVAESGEVGLEMIAVNGPYAVIVSDCRMPGMDGVEFLSRVKDLTPDSVRMMLTGQPDLEIAMKAVNEGRVFRFMTKPTAPEAVARAVEDGLKYYSLVKSERELDSLKKWRKIIEEILLAFVTLVEARDPYTAGHEQRVALLAQLIAQELGLKEDQIEAIRMAATIHDIGKLYVPSEFLNKPGRLTEVEFNVIKTHTQVGYDVLSPIEFEYPISGIVHQHHERLDGSGYPQGLKNGEILLEARIIMVADVVEAMTSHRPYRPGLGLEVALDEIIQHKGTFYDPDAVDACFALFTKKNFSLERSLPPAVKE